MAVNPVPDRQHFAPTEKLPTPTSSLEEARKRLYWKIQDARSHMALVREADEAFAEYDAFIKATARAEVIREVEAYWLAYDERLQSPAAWDRLRTAEARLRALSQGGEGKSDG